MVVAQAGVSPRGVVVAGRNHLDLVVGELFNRQQLRHRDVGDDQRTLLAQQDRARTGERVVFGQPQRLAVGHPPGSVIPRDWQGRTDGVLGGGEDVRDGRLAVPDLAIDRRRLGGDREGGGQLEGGEDRIENVAAKVAQLAIREILPGPPVERVVDLGKPRAGGGDPQPLVPMDVGGDRFGPGGAVIDEDPAHRPALPRMDLADLADDTVVHQLGRRAVRLV